MDTMISVSTVLIILFLHWVADFVFQTDKMAQGKSKNWADLLSHTVVYMGAFIPFMVITMGANGILFCLITFVVHTIQDYFTSRLNSRLWKEGKIHYFFVSIGFDQFLHFSQLLLTYKLLTN